MVRTESVAAELLKTVAQEFPDSRAAKVYLDKMAVKWKVLYGSSFVSMTEFTLTKRGSPDFRIDVSPPCLDSVLFTAETEPAVSLVMAWHPEIVWPSDEYRLVDVVVIGTKMACVYEKGTGSERRDHLVMFLRAEFDKAVSALSMSLL